MQRQDKQPQKIATTFFAGCESIFAVRLSSRRYERIFTVTRYLWRLQALDEAAVASCRVCVALT